MIQVKKSYLSHLIIFLLFFFGLGLALFFGGRAFWRGQEVLAVPMIVPSPAPSPAPPPPPASSPPAFLASSDSPCDPCSLEMIGELGDIEHHYCTGAGLTCHGPDHICAECGLQAQYCIRGAETCASSTVVSDDPETEACMLYEEFIFVGWAKTHTWQHLESQCGMGRSDCEDWFVGVADCDGGGFFMKDDYVPGGSHTLSDSSLVWDCYYDCVEECSEHDWYHVVGLCEEPMPDDDDADDDDADDADDDIHPPDPAIIQPHSSIDQKELSARKSKLIGSGYKPRSTQQIVRPQEYPDFLPAPPSRLPREGSILKQISAQVFHLFTLGLFKP